MTGDRWSFPRPGRPEPGWIGLVAAWFAALVIAQLTGAVAVVILLGAGLVAGVVALVAGALDLRRYDAPAPEFPGLVTAGVVTPFDLRWGDGEVPTAWSLTWDHPVDGDTVVADPARTSTADSSRPPEDDRPVAVFPERGVVDAFEARVRSAGTAGLVPWTRRRHVATAPVEVAPPAAPTGTRVVVLPVSADDPLVGDPTLEPVGRRGATAEPDGIRPWRDGDAERSVHWRTTLRTGELVVHDERSGPPVRRTVLARSGTDDPDHEAARTLRSIEDGLAGGEDVRLIVVPADAVVDAMERADAVTGPAMRVRDRDQARRLLASLDLGARSPRSAAASTAPAPLGRRARVWTALASAIALTMLVGALGWSPTSSVVVAAAVALAAAGSIVVSGGDARRVRVLRGAVAATALAGLIVIASRTGQVGNVLGLLRGPMPEFFVLLVVLHGVETVDRRTARVHLAVTAVVVSYATGLRVDPAIGWWLLSWALAFGVAMAAIGGRGPVPSGRRARTAIVTLAGLAATVAVLSVVPIPDGPVRLTFPAIVDEVRTVGVPGAIARPDGALVGRADDGGPDRGIAGQVGAYTGFADRFDTSVRGALGDQVVMRVRAPEPDFWRGQTFADFDGRFWTADDDVGVLRQPGTIPVPRTLGDPRGVPVAVEPFIQTFHAEVDLGNLVFGAYRPSTVVFDGPVWLRPDGAIRAGVTVTAGSVYTVESSRARVTSEALRRQGDVAGRLTDAGRSALASYLAVPGSTTERTRDLARSLAGPTTYDTVRNIETWLAANVEYDLFAPVPGPGQDGVDHFVFESRLGFCEQIATSTTIMLRTLGVPARLATGYLPGERNGITGVFEVRARDAHAWVEVWFPETGWQPFDPTATVPLAGDVQRTTVGGDLLVSLVAVVTAAAVPVALALALVSVVGAAAVFVHAVSRRRARGAWGRAQDRFDAVARRLGLDPDRGNGALARGWRDVDPDGAADAVLVATALDRHAFAPAHTSSDGSIDPEELASVRTALDRLAGRRVVTPARDATTASPSPG